MDHEATRQLLDAIRTDNIEQAAAALDAGADIEAQFGACGRPLGLAARHGRVELAALLLGRGAQVNGTNPHRRTALHHATQSGHMEVVELLVSRGASLDLADKDGFTPLLTALSRGEHEVATWLVDRGARLDVGTVRGATVLYLAACREYPGLARLLQDANVVATMDAKELQYGETAFHEVVRRGRLDHVRLLLDAGATVDVMDGRQHTPLHFACELGHVDVVRELLQRGARVDAVAQYGWTPLMFCSDQQAVRLLLEFGADRSLRNNRGGTARDMAVADGDDEVVEVLDAYFPMQLQMEQMLLGLCGPTESPLTRFAQHSAYEPKVLSIVAAFHSGKNSAAFEQLQREARG